MKLLLVVIFAAGIRLDAGTLFSDLGTGSVYSTSSGSTVMGTGLGGSSIVQARPFTVSGTGDFLVSQIDIGVVFQLGSNTYVASIFTDSSDQPGTQLGSWTVTATEAAGGCCLLATQTGITGVTLTGGVEYFMTLAAGTATTGGRWQANTLGQFSGIVESFDNGSTWINEPVSPNAAFDVLGDPAGAATPEPGSLILLGTGLAGLLAVQRKRAAV